jgi:hypothetical protein
MFLCAKCTVGRAGFNFLWLLDFVQWSVGVSSLRTSYNFDFTFSRFPLYLSHHFVLLTPLLSFVPYIIKIIKWRKMRLAGRLARIWAIIIVYQSLFDKDECKRNKMAVFWVVAPCSLLYLYRRFRGFRCPYCLLIILIIPRARRAHRPDDRCSKHIRDVCKLIQTIRRHEPEYSLFVLVDLRIWDLTQLLVLSIFVLPYALFWTWNCIFALHWKRSTFTLFKF